MYNNPSYDWFSYMIYQRTDTQLMLSLVIITKFFPLCLKMAEIFLKLDNILRGWAKDTVQKVLSRHLKRY